MIFRVVAMLPESTIHKKYREMYFNSDAIVSFYNFEDEEGKERTCVRLKDGNVIITETPVLSDLKKILTTNGDRVIPLGG